MRFLFPVFLFFLAGCSTYQTKVSSARSLMSSGRYDEAAKELEPLANKEGDDQLLYLFDYATALQLAGRYDESTKVFLSASKIAEVKDYHSLSRIAGSLLLSEGMVQYKGEDYEKLLINVYLAQNFAMKGDLDEAMVETRRLDEILNKYRIEAKRDYEQNAFAVYLSGIIWETERKWDDAYIAYNRVHQLNSGIDLLQKDLLRTARAAQREDASEKWKKAFPKVSVDNWYKDKKIGELILIYHQGKAPVKRSHPNSPRFPKLFAVPTTTQRALVKVSGRPGHNSEVISERIYSVQDVAIKTLDDAYAGLIAKRVGGVAVKAVVADQIRQKNEALGLLAWVGMNLADQADLRQWSTLPESFQIARIPLDNGTYKINIQGLDGSGRPSGEQSPEKEVVINGGKKTFVMWRSFQ